MIGLVEFPADDLDRAQRFWRDLLGAEFRVRVEGEETGAEPTLGGGEIGLHPRGAGPGDVGPLPYFAVRDLAASLGQVVELGGEVTHPGERRAICRDSEGSPFG